MAQLVDLTGQRFGRLVVLERGADYVSPQGRKVVRWRCKCDCGNIKDISATHLKKGDCQSCGCFHQERLVEAGRLNGTTHGLSRTRIYRLFQNMKNRCNDKNAASYQRYGGRGISVCKEWNEAGGFERFYSWSLENGYQEGLTLDRIDVNGDYSPDNCRWTDWETQYNNTTKSIKLTYNGKTQTAAQWARELGLDRHTIYDRIKKGYPIEYILGPRLSTRPNIPKTGCS